MAVKKISGTKTTTISTMGSAIEVYQEYILKMKFSISGEILTIDTVKIYQDNKTENKFSLKATSGSEDLELMSNPEKTNREGGPIPIGKYHLIPSELNDLNANIFKRWWLNEFGGDWGSFLIRIHKDPSNINKRDGFFLHGGDRLGTAGCIDVGGGIKGNDTTKKLVKLIKGSTNSIPLEVTK